MTKGYVEVTCGVVGGDVAMGDDKSDNGDGLVKFME